MGVAATVPRNAALWYLQFGAAVVGRTKGVKSAASRGVAIAILSCGPRLYFFEK